MTTSPHALRTAFRDEGCRVGTIHNVVFSIWSDAPTAERLDALTRAVRVIMRNEGPIGGLHVIRIPAAQLTRIDDSVRASLAALYDVTRDRTGGLSIILEAEGFAAAALRSLVSSVTLLVRTGLKQRMFADVPAGAAWLFPIVRTEKSPPDASLLAAFRELEAL